MKSLHKRRSLHWPSLSKICTQTDSTSTTRMVTPWKRNLFSISVRNPSHLHHPQNQQMARISQTTCLQRNLEQTKVALTIRLVNESILWHLAVEPSQTRCCGRIFCQDHLQNWLNTTSDHCPSCGSYCSTDTVIFPPSASPNMPYAAAPSSLRNASQADPDSFSASSDSSDDSDSAEGRTSDHNHLLSAFSLIKNTASSTMDPELAGGVLGKVLSIVALTLVFYVLNS
ncbi:hypothetical protein BT96DRAFT_105331 [Gymnopus androsaceus JB14]|uniref:Uncharacterized protein n=1 Tax=Gymnopus androsaceus JB14 TaxID=1447944 RepID=A0A6A4IA54_9AGAR|nr:hypothetical protein BT96DRAFT_105331 [Gymnopus androsaceus JB14]